MKLVANLLYCLILLTMYSCNTEEKSHLSNAVFHLETDSCRTIQILNNEKILVKRDCKERSPNDKFYSRNLSGMLEVMYCFDTLTYQVDSIGNNGQYISALDKNNRRCYGLHIVNHDYFWVVTPLKKGKRIDYHFTEPLIYRKEQTKNDSLFDESLTLQIYKKPTDDLFYIAYNQHQYKNSKKDDTGSSIIDLQENTTYYKTDLEINPTFYALKKYQINLFDASINSFLKVPILYHKEYDNYRQMTAAEKQVFHRNKKINNHFVVVYRFNPGRERVVDKLYNEKVHGQVQTFEWVEVSNE